MEYLICLIVGLFIGWHASSLFHRWLAASLFQHLGLDKDKLIELNQKLEREILAEEAGTPDAVAAARIEILIEKDKDVLYAYNKSTQQFLFQSPDSAAIMKQLADKFRGQGQIVIVEGGEHIVA
jgi:RNase P/RNase MRP subunit p30